MTSITSHAELVKEKRYFLSDLDGYPPMYLQVKYWRDDDTVEYYCTLSHSIRYSGNSFVFGLKSNSISRLEEILLTNLKIFIDRAGDKIIRFRPNEGY